MADKTQELFAGSIGHFWIQMTGRSRLEESTELKGFVHLNPDRFVELRVLHDDPMDLAPFVDPPRMPQAIFGMTETTGVILADFMARGSTRNFGGSRASVERFSASTLLTSVSLDRASGSRVTELSVYFDEGLLWSGLSAVESSFELDEANRLRGATFKLWSGSGHLSGGSLGSFDLDVGPHWETSGGDAALTLRTALEVQLTTRRPRPIKDFTDTLMRVQDLLSVAFDRLVVAKGGRARLEGYGTDDDHAFLWHNGLMEIPGSSPPRSRRSDDSPLFTMDDLGGAEAIRRWILLSRTVPDAVSATTAAYRRGFTTPAARLQEVAAAVEYYVNVSRQRRSAQWAAKSEEAPSHAVALARRVGAPFESLVGDIHVWGARFLGAYNGLKHDPGYRRDPEELRLLAWSGDLLLLAALLNRAAGRKAPSDRMLNDYRIARGGERLRELLGT